MKYLYSVSAVYTEANAAAAGAVLNSLPGGHTHTVDIPLSLLGGETPSAYLCSFPAHVDVANAVEGLIISGVPECFVGMRVIPIQDETTRVAWLAALGYEPYGDSAL